MNTSKMLKLAATPRKWFNIDTAGDIPEIMIYDQIGLDWWGDGVSARDFRDEFNKLDADEINLHINSPGGMIYEGLAIYTTIVSHKATVNGFVDGMAASIASVILMATDKIIMPESSDLMIHDPWSIVIGGADDMRAEAKELDRLKDQIVKIYSDRSNIDSGELNKLMKKETWISGQEALDMGFADEVIENKKAAACAFDLDIFESVPEHHKKFSESIKKRSIEESLRDAGWSRKEALKIASGPKPDQRDVEEGDKENLQGYEELASALQLITMKG